MGRQLLPRIAVALVAIEHAERVLDLPGAAQRSLRDGMQGAVRRQ